MTRNGEKKVYRREIKPVRNNLPPHDFPSEQAVLGCILLDSKIALPLAMDILGEEEAFYDLKHQEIYRSMMDLFNKRIPIDLVTVQEDLKRKGILEQIGGMTYVSALPESAPSAGLIQTYAEIVMENASLRRMVQACSETVRQIMEREGSAEELLQKAERSIIAVRIKSKSSRPQIRELVHECNQEIEEMHRAEGKIQGLETGFIDFDKMTGGLQPGDMIVIAARPSLGKTSLVSNIVEHVAIESKLPVGVFSLEMTAKSLVMRMLCSRARVNLRNIRDGFMAERDFPKLTGAAGKIAKAPIYLEDSRLSIWELRAKARQMHLEYGLKLIVIDYLQLIASSMGPKTGFENREREVSLISSGVKELAKELNTPVIVLSQLSRQVDKEKNRKPRMSDIRDSGSVEQDADLVALLCKGDIGDEEENFEAIPIELILAKQRNGPTGTIHLTFFKSFTRFESAAKVSDVPSE